MMLKNIYDQGDCMFCKKNTSISYPHQQKLNQSLKTRLFFVIKKSFFVLSLSAIASFEIFANIPDFNVDEIAFPSALSEDKVESLSELKRVSPSSIKVERAARSVLVSGLPVGCTQAELTAAIIDGNNAGTAILQLPSNCTYTVQIPATATEAFPIITGNITIIGGKGTVIARGQTAAAFRIFTVNSGATLTLRQLTLENGNTAGQGGGILDNGALVVENITLSHNKASNGGGISVSAGATAQVLASTLLSNTATGVGGGGMINFGELYVKNSYLSGNAAPINGGAINTQGSGITTIMLSLITYNTSAGLGGALSNLGTLNVSQSIVNYNTGSAGGGIATGNNNVTISKTSNTAILNNQSDNCSPLNTIEGCVN